MKYTKFFAATAAVLAVAGLAACDTEAPQTTSTVRDAIITETPVEASTGGLGRDEFIYITALDRGGVDYASTGDAINAGQAVCMTLDEGHTLQNLMIAFATTGEPMAPGIANEDAGSIAGAAISVFCPQHTDQMDQFIADWSN